MRLFALLLLVVSACPPPPFQPCDRFLVDATGNLNQGFAGGVGGGPGAGSASPIGIVGSPLTVTLFAPLSSCVEDTLRADATLADPQNLPLAFTLDSAPTRVGSQGVVKTSLSFTPTQAGRHTLHVSFEPSIGARNLLIDVASDGLQGLTTRVPITNASCLTNALWPLSDDTVACEERAMGTVSLTSADGGVTRFPGEQLVVVDTVLWSINKPSLSLERRVFEDGGVRLTDSFVNFPATPTPGMHDVDLALRFRSNGRLVLVRIIPGGNRVQELTLDGTAGPPLAYFEEPNEAIFRWSPSECFFGNCTNFPDVVGLDPGFVWRAVSFAFIDGPPAADVGVYPRSTAARDGGFDVPRFSLDYAVAALATPAFGFERLPVWLSVTPNQRRVLVSVEEDALSLTAWPQSGVLRVGRHHLVLTDPDLGFVRVVRK